MKLKKMTSVLLCLVLAGCGESEAAAQSSADATASSDTAVSQTILVSYADYQNAVENVPEADSYTAAVNSSYDMHYSDDTMDAYSTDGVLVYADDQAHMTQNIDSNGLKSTMDGYWYGGRLYNTYNGVTYYEDMDLEALKSSMLVPMDAECFDEDDILNLSGSQKGNNTTYNILLNTDAAADIFSSRYDVYGLEDYDDYKVTKGSVTDTFDQDGNLISEKTEFDIEVSYEGEDVTVNYASEVNYSQIGSSTVEISDDLKNEQASYVSYQDIDTSQIQTMTDDDDSAEDTVEATFKKRLVNRLNYTAEGEVYTLSFNSDNEAYEIDFSNHTFTYSERTIKYSYNWESDVGSMGSCTVDFANDNHRTSECEESTAEMIETVKTYFEMELYYCGLTLEDLQNETE